MIITCLDCGHVRGGVLCAENALCPKCGGKKIDAAPCVEGPQGPEGLPGGRVRNRPLRSTSHVMKTWKRYIRRYRWEKSESLRS